MNVMESEGIRFQLARRMRAVTGVSAEPSCPHQVFVPVANPVLCRSSRAARKLPFRLAGQSVAGPVERRDRLTLPEVKRLQLLLLAQLDAEFRRVIPTQPFHRVIDRFQPGDRLFSSTQRGEVGRIYSHHFFILGLRDFIHAQIDRLRQDHLVPRGFRLDALLHVLVIRDDILEGRFDEDRFDLERRAAHREFARRDKSELHADGVGVLDRHVEVLGPRLLVFLRLLGIKWRNRRRWCLGRPTMPANEN